MKKIKYGFVFIVTLLFLFQCTVLSSAAYNYDGVRLGMFEKYKSFSFVPKLVLQYYIKPSDFPSKDKELVNAAALWNNKVPGLELVQTTSKDSADIILYLANSTCYNDGGINQSAGECNLYDANGFCVNNDLSETSSTYLSKYTIAEAANYTKAECIVFMKSPRTGSEYVQVMMHEIGHALGLSDLPEQPAFLGSVMMPGRVSGRPSVLSTIDLDNLKKRWLEIPYNECKYLRADFNKDGAVNMSDVMLLAQNFNKIITSDTSPLNKYDINNDNAINMSDVISISKVFGQT